jgi:hypothetical protein
MNEIDHFKVFVLCSSDVTTDVDKLHVKRIHLVTYAMRSCFVHLVVYNTMMKTEFKMDII